MDNRQHHRIPLLLLFLLPLVIHCAGSASNESGDSCAAVHQASASDTLFSALSQGLTGSYQAAGGSGDGAVLLEGTDPSALPYSCTISPDRRAISCVCPGGGSMTEEFTQAIAENDEGATFTGEFRALFESCVVEACGGNRTVSGAMSGSINGTAFRTGEASMTIRQATAGKCSGITVDETSVGFSMTMTFNSADQAVSGTICFDPPGEVLSFDNFEELTAITDPEEICQRIETSSEGEPEGADPCL